MGNKNAKISLNPQDIAGLELSYTKTTTNAELAIGNREMIEFLEIQRSGTFTVEKGRLKICTHYVVSVDDLSRFFQEKIYNHNFMVMKNKSAKAFNTSGSDSGRSIILNLPSQQIRKEVRCSERSTLPQKDRENFEIIEREISQYNHTNITEKNHKLKVKFDAKLVSEFLDQEIPTPFSLRYKTSEQWKHAIIVMTGGASGEIIIEEAYLPKSVQMQLAVGNYSLMDEEDSKILLLPDAMTIEQEKNQFIFSVNDQKLTLEQQ